MWSALWRLQPARFVASGVPASIAYYIIAYVLEWRVSSRWDYMVLWSIIGSGVYYPLNFFVQARYTFGHRLTDTTRSVAFAYARNSLLLTALNAFFIFALQPHSNPWRWLVPLLAGCMLMAVNYYIVVPIFGNKKTLVVP